MMYLLTQEEFTRLKTARNSEAIEMQKSKLQTLCTKIADTMPIEWGWGADPDPKPWGCILSESEEWYCDQCPVQEICPYTAKSFSK
jgi:hypothetical protein